MKPLQKSEPVIRTLADYWSEAGMEVPADWAGKIELSKTPRPYQVLDLNHLASHIRSGLYSDPGLGKTLPSQAHVLWLVAQGNRAACIMPPVLVPQFFGSFHSNFPGVEAFISIEMFSGQPAERNETLARWNQCGWPQVVICSYDMFAGKSPTEIKALRTTRRKNLLKRKEKEGLPRVLSPEEEQQVAQLSPADEINHATWKAKGYTHLLVDEATAVKTPGSDLSRAVAGFVGKHEEGGNGLVLMTGSPVENNLTDLYGLIKLTVPGRYTSARHFENVHCEMSGGRFPKIVGYRNEDYAYQSLYLRGRRVTKKEAIGLPPRIVTEIQVNLAKAHQELYTRLTRERVLELGDKVIDATAASSLYVKTQRMLLCPELFHDEENLGPWKVENTLLTALDELIHSLGNRKLLISAWFTESILKLAKRYEKRNPALLYGAITGNDREKNKAKFIEDPSCQLMICNPRSGGVGIDGLQTVASYVAFIEPISVPGLFEQTLSRLHRSGQKADSVNIYLFTALKTVAVRLRNNLVAKEQAANSVVRDSKTLLAELMGEEGIQGSIA